MPTYEQGDSVKVLFPHTTVRLGSFAPALVVSTSNGNDALGLLWVVMVTSAENRGWPGHVAIAYLSATGLPAPSLVRTAKIATIESRDAAPLGRVDDGVRVQIMPLIANRLALQPEPLCPRPLETAGYPCIAADAFARSGKGATGT
jgi:mRNA interferase MazF